MSNSFNIMAEDEDGVSNKKISQNLNKEGNAEDTEQIPARPDLGIEEAKYNSNENDDRPTTEAPSSSSKSGGAVRKEENPFSFRHFLKRDLSLPGSSTYEHTGARPKVYASTVQHSPSRDSSEGRREKTRSAEPPTPPRDVAPAPSAAALSDNTTSSSSVEIPFSVVDNSQSKSNLYSDNSEAPFYHRPNLASEPLGMPSLPDFVQDHILVEQAYLNSNGPISVDLENLPDFTFNTNYNSSSWGRRNNSGYGGRNYDYDPYGASTSDGSGPSDRNIPLDLPVGAEAAGLPLDLPPHLNLDLTESVNPADRRNNSPRNTFPLDLPLNAGLEATRLPDFLPVHPGRTSPEPEHHDEQLSQILSELERTRSELLTERARRSRLESEVASAHLQAEVLRREAERARAAAARDRLGEVSGDCEVNATSPDSESTIIKLKNQIKKLKEELSASRAEARSLRSSQLGAARDLRRASSVAETSLRELLAGLDQLKTLSSTLDPT